MCMDRDGKVVGNRHALRGGVLSGIDDACDLDSAICEIGQRAVGTVIVCVNHGALTGFDCVLVDIAARGARQHDAGPFVAVEAGERSRWMEQLGSFEVALVRDGEEIDRGAAGNVMGGGPLAALERSPGGDGVW